jgi:hypothetical protein
MLLFFDMVFIYLFIFNKSLTNLKQGEEQNKHYNVLLILNNFQ